MEDPALRTSGGPGKLYAPKKKKKHLDDLSTIGIGCCHLAGNYLPIRAVDGPAKKKGVAVKDQAQSQGGRESKKERDEEIGGGEVQGKS